MTKENMTNMINEVAKELGIKIEIVESPDPMTQLRLALSMGSDAVIFGQAFVDGHIEMYSSSFLKSWDEMSKFLNKIGKLKYLFAAGRNLEKAFRNFIKDTLVHENRHIKQIEYVRSKGWDVEDTMEKINQGNYWQRRHEIDAFCKQYFGFGLPLSWVFKKVAP